MTCRYIDQEQVTCGAPATHIDPCDGGMPVCAQHACRKSTPLWAAVLDSIARQLRDAAPHLDVMDAYGPLAGEARVLAERVACLAVRVEEKGQSE